MHVATLRAMAQRVIDQDQRQHGFGNRRRADTYAGIVPAMRCDHGRIAGTV